MNVEEIRNYALSLNHVIESFPFGESVLVLKTNNKIFLLLPLDVLETQFNVKCDPEIATELRERYPESVLPGYHMNKKHWNTILVDGKLTTLQLKSMIRDSYHLVAKKSKH
jgi:predicted DNA-binding protein (MmcQ/YjbR family)